MHLEEQKDKKLPEGGKQNSLQNKSNGMKSKLDYFFKREKAKAVNPEQVMAKVKQICDFDLNSETGESRITRD